MSQLIKLETAKLAKGKGYDHILEDTNFWYEPNFMCYVPRRDNGEYCPIGMYFWDTNQNIQQYETSKAIPAPTQEELRKWLREKFGYHVVIIPTVTSDWTFKSINVISELDNDVISGLKSVSDLPPYKEVSGEDFSTYELALEAALIKVLKQIS